MITEEIIDGVLLEYRENSEILRSDTRTFAAEQPALLALIFSDEYMFLTGPEREYMFFLTLVIWKSVIKHRGQIRTCSQKEIAGIEEKNWELLNLQKAGNFRERLNVFFENYPEEDLLAFVEDSIAVDDESMITKAGREPLFIVLKTQVDVLTGLGFLDSK